MGGMAEAHAPDAERRELEGLLYRGLMERLKNAEWYLTGIAVGLESLQRFLEIAELVYREQQADSEAARRVARLKSVHEALQRFAATGSPQERAELLFLVRRPLALLVRDLGEEGPQRRLKKGFLAQLAADVQLALRRIKTLEQLKIDVAVFDGFLARTFGGKRKIAEFIDHYGPFARKLGFDDPTTLEKPEGARAVAVNAGREIAAMKRHLEQLHAGIYGGRTRDASKGGIDADFAEGPLLAALERLAKDGHAYLMRAASIYGDALHLLGQRDKLPLLESLDAEDSGPVRVPRGADAPGTPAATAPPPSVREILASTAFDEPGGFLGDPDEDVPVAVVGTMLVEGERPSPSPSPSSPPPSPSPSSADEPRWRAAVAAALAEEGGLPPAASAPAGSAALDPAPSAPSPPSPPSPPIVAATAAPPAEEGGFEAPIELSGNFDLPDPAVLAALREPPPSGDTSAVAAPPVAAAPVAAAPVAADPVAADPVAAPVVAAPVVAAPVAVVAAAPVVEPAPVAAAPVAEAEIHVLVELGEDDVVPPPGADQVVAAPPAAPAVELAVVAAPVAAPVEAPAMVDASVEAPVEAPAVVAAPVAAPVEAPVVVAPEDPEDAAALAPLRAAESAAREACAAAAAEAQRIATELRAAEEALAAAVAREAAADVAAKTAEEQETQLHDDAASARESERFAEIAVEEAEEKLREAEEEAKRAAVVSALSPEELRALAERLVKDGKLSVDEVEAARRK